MRPISPISTGWRVERRAIRGPVCSVRRAVAGRERVQGLFQIFGKAIAGCRELGTARSLVVTPCAASDCAVPDRVEEPLRDA